MVRLFSVFKNNRSEIFRPTEFDPTSSGNYEKKRQEFQDHIVQKLLDGTIIEDCNGRVCRTPTEPYIVFTAGVMVRENRYVGLK